MSKLVSELSPAQIARRKKVLTGLYVGFGLTASATLILWGVLGEDHWATITAAVASMAFFCSTFAVGDTIDPAIEKSHKEAVENYEYFTVAFAVVASVGLGIVFAGLALHAWAGMSQGWLAAIAAVGTLVVLSAFFVNEHVLKEAKAAAQQGGVTASA